MLGLDKPFRLTHEFCDRGLGKHLGTLQDTTSETPSSTPALASDDEFCRAVLDEPIHQAPPCLCRRDPKKVMAIQMGVRSHRRAPLEARARAHWPGELTPERAVEIRDPRRYARQHARAPELRRHAPRGGCGAGGYRIAAEEA